jgi:hypothetical protein
MPDSTRTVAIELEPLILSAFSVRHEVVGGRVMVTLVGNADSDVTAAFAHYLERLHDWVMAAELREVTFDFRQLYFLTSACVKCLVVAIKRLMRVDPRQQYRMRLLTSRALRWQERSFEVLCQIAPMLVSMETE